MLFIKFLIDCIRNRWTSKSIFSAFIDGAVRFLQFVFGVAVIGLYAQDLVRAKMNGDSMDPKWLYATIVGSLASLSSLIYLFMPLFTHRPLGSLHMLHIPALVHDAILCILWLTLFGIFGKKFLTADSGMGSEDDLTRMKNAVWVDLINLALWVFTAAWQVLRLFRARRKAKQGEKVEDDPEQMHQ